MHTVTLTAFSPAGCQAITTQQITVYPTPDFTFVAEPDSGCSPLTVTFPSVVGAVSYQWDLRRWLHGCRTITIAHLHQHVHE